MHVEWAHHSDLDFVLAHTVLNDALYAELLATRDLGRELILDNSYHELGYPLPLSDLLEAAQRCRADYVIAPDKVGDVQFNTRAFLEAQSVLAGYKIAVVMTGTPTGDALEREEFLAAVRDADMLCCTFKYSERLDWYTQSTLARRWSRVHLLGVSSVIELLRWNQIVRTSKIDASVDTGKPLKCALRNQHLASAAVWRSSAQTTESGLPSEISQKILTLRREDISPAVERLFSQNVAVLRVCLE